MKTEKQKNWIIIILVIFSILSAVGVSNHKKELREKDSLLEALGDTVKIWKDEYGRSTAKIKVLETEGLKSFLKLASQDKAIKELQELVKENQRLLKKGGSTTIIKTETEIDTVVKTVIDFKNNTYTGKFQDDWLMITSISDSAKTEYMFRSRSELSLIIGTEKQGLFKKRKPYAIVNDKNPHTGIKDLRTYQVSKPKPDRFIIGPSIGGGALITNGEVRAGIFVGATLTYRIIGF